jgi:methylated-DNA-[protein]-cysteine S-methyltransferase
MNDTYSWRQTTPHGTLSISAGKDGAVRSVHLGAKRKGQAVASDAPPAVKKTAAAFERYFAGDAHALDKTRIDLNGVTNEFQRSVLMTLREMVGPGATISYSELAAAVGHPGAARAVGSVMATNPVPIIIPCHRVLAANGGLGGYGGGLEMKRALLKIEGVEIKPATTPSKGAQRRMRL